METPGIRRIAIDLDVHRAIERGRRSVGESENDILRRLLLELHRPAADPHQPAADPRRPSADRRPSAPGRASSGPAGPRRRGLWSLELAGRRMPAANLKHAYRLLLCALAAAHPHFLDDLALQKERSRRFVARAPAELYGGPAHLVRHAEPLVEGWYFDTNLSATQVAKRARIAARLCGLFYGQDVRILDNLREI